MPTKPATSPHYEPHEKGCTVELFTMRPTCSTIWCEHAEEHNEQRKKVWSSEISGRLINEPCRNPELRLELTHFSYRDTGRTAKSVLSLITDGSEVSLLELAAFAEALSALVQDAIAQGANCAAWNERAEQVPGVVAVLDPRATQAGA